MHTNKRPLSSVIFRWFGGTSSSGGSLLRLVARDDTSERERQATDYVVEFAPAMHSRADNHTHTFLLPYTPCHIHT